MRRKRSILHTYKQINIKTLVYSIGTVYVYCYKCAQNVHSFCLDLTYNLYSLQICKNPLHFTYFLSLLFSPNEFAFDKQSLFTLNKKISMYAMNTQSLRLNIAHICIRFNFGMFRAIKLIFWCDNIMHVALCMGLIITSTKSVTVQGTMLFVALKYVRLITLIILCIMHIWLTITKYPFLVWL